jgi:flavin-dependent dehydrogenase
MCKRYEVVVIGGGPAGSTTAHYLANTGFDICLIEKKIFPRETLCGEFLSAEVINNINRLNLSEGFYELNPNPINSFRFFNKRGDYISSALKFSAYGLKRSLFDNFLLTAAAKKGVEIIQPAEVKSVIKSGDEFFIEAYKENEKIEIISRIVVASYGRQNMLDKYLHRPFAEEKTRLNGIKFHVKKKYLNNYRPDEIQIYAGDGIYCGVNLIDEDIITLCFLEDRSNYNFSVRERLITLMETNKSFKKLLSSDFENVIKELPVYGTGNIYFGRRNVVEKGIYMVGDAAGVIAPLAGDGIGMAMDSGSLLSSVLTNQKNSNLSNLETQRFYNYEWNNLFKKRLIIAKLIQEFVLRNKLNYLGFSMVKLFPPVLNYCIYATRN